MIESPEPGIGVPGEVKLGSVERFVRIPHVDPQDKVLTRTIALQPLAGGRRRAGAHPIPLQPARGRVAEVELRRAEILQLVSRRGVRRGDRIHVVPIGVLPADELPSGEPADVVIRVDREHGGIEDHRRHGTGLGDQVGQHAVVRLERLPAARHEPEPAREQVVAARDRRIRAAVEPVEQRRLRRQPVQVGRADERLALAAGAAPRCLHPVRGEVIAPERVAHEDQHVHRATPPPTRPAARC